VRRGVAETSQSRHWLLQSSKKKKKVKAVLETVGKSLQDAGGAAGAGDVASALKRAKTDAADAKGKLADLKDGKAGNGADKKAAAQDLAADLARLAKQLQNRDFANGNKQFADAANQLGK